MKITNLLKYLVVLAVVVVAFSAHAGAQETFPTPPQDRAGVYLAGEPLRQISLEATRTSLAPGAVAAKNGNVNIDIQGANSLTVVTSDEPVLYLFVAVGQGVHPPLWVRFTEHKGERRLTVITEKGITGFAVPSDQIVKPHYRVLATIDGMLFMEVRPRTKLVPGEYGVVGDDPKHLVTFRVSSGTK